MTENNNRNTNVISSGIFTENSLASVILSLGHSLLHMFSYIKCVCRGGSCTFVVCVCMCVECLSVHDLPVCAWALC